MWKQPNTSTPARLPLGSGAQTLKLAADMRTTRQPQLAHPALGRPALADDVEGVGVRADPGQVDVGVVPDHVAGADGAEQPAVAEVGVEPALLDEVVEHPPRGRRSAR